MAIFSEGNLDYEDDLPFKNLYETILGAALEASGPLNSWLKININLAAQLAVGAYHAFTDKLALVGTATGRSKPIGKAVKR